MGGGEKAWEMGNGCQLFYYGIDGRRNGVGIILDPELKVGVVEVKRETDRMITMKLQVGRMACYIMSVYAPQTGCEEEQKDEFWGNFVDAIRRGPTIEMLWVMGDLNGHVGEGNDGAADGMGKQGKGVKSED